MEDVGFPQFLKHTTYIPRLQAPTLLGGFSRRIFCETFEASMRAPQDFGILEA